MDTIFIYKCLWFWRAFFMCKMKTHSRLAGLFFRVLVPGSSTPRCESYSSSSLYALPPLPCVPKMYWFVFISDSVPGSPPGHRSPAGSKEQEERPRKPGVDEVAALPRLCCAADLDPLEPRRKHALRNRQGTGTSRTWEWFYFHLAQVPCALSLPPSFTVLWWRK